MAPGEHLPRQDGLAFLPLCALGSPLLFCESPAGGTVAHGNLHSTPALGFVPSSHWATRWRARSAKDQTSPSHLLMPLFSHPFPASSSELLNWSSARCLTVPSLTCPLTCLSFPVTQPAGPVSRLQLSCWRRCQLGH